MTVGRFSRVFLANHLVHHPHKADGVRKAQHQNRRLGSAGAGARCGLAALLAAAIALFTLSGCSPPPRTVDVVGRVTYNGAPVKGALVIFFAEKFGDDHPAASVTDATGRYELRTYFSATDIPRGAVPNDYVVVVQKYREPDIAQVTRKILALAGLPRDINRYLAEEAVHDLWPDGVPDGWPDGYVPSKTLPPASICNDKERLAKLHCLQRGIPLLPLRYADSGTSELRASVERSDGPLTFDFDLTGEIDETALRREAEFWLGPPK